MKYKCYNFMFKPSFDDSLPLRAGPETLLSTWRETKTPPNISCYARAFRTADVPQLELLAGVREFLT